MNRDSLISVIMSVYNEPEDYLRYAIESILNQTFKDFEFIIILDNPNNIKAEKIIKEYQKKDNRIIFLKNEKNLGLAASLNRGIEIAKGKYIARMDADDISMPNRLEEQVKFMERNEGIDLLFTWIYFIDENGNIIKEFKPEIKESLENQFFKEHLFVHPTLFCKSEVLKKNKYDVTQKKSQDFELWLRLISKKYKFFILPKFLLKYRIYKNIFEKRIHKQLIYSRYSIKALWKNKKYYLSNKYFWKIFFWYFGMYIFLKIMPKKILIILIKLKGD